MPAPREDSDPHADAEAPRSGRRALIVLTVVSLALRIGWASVPGHQRRIVSLPLYVAPRPELLRSSADDDVDRQSRLDDRRPRPSHALATDRFHPAVLGIDVDLGVLDGPLVRRQGGPLRGRRHESDGLFPGRGRPFALPDGPLLFFSLLTMMAPSERCCPSRPNLALAFGRSCLGGAMLSKYHAAFLPLGALLYIAATPSARPLLRRPGPYLAVVIGLAEFLPVLVWNAQHDWASFLFQGGRAAGTQFKPVGWLIFLFGPMAYLMPWIWFTLAAILVKRLGWFRSLKGIERLLVCLAIVPLGFFFAVSALRPILPHWVLVGFVPPFPILGFKWWKFAQEYPLRMHRRVMAMTTCAGRGRRGRASQFRIHRLSQAGTRAKKSAVGNRSRPNCRTAG